MQTESQMAANPQTNPTDLTYESAGKPLPSTSTIAIYYYYLAQKLILILSSMEGGRLSRPRHCTNGVQPVPKSLHRSGCCNKHNCLQWDSNLGHVTPQSCVLPLDHCNLHRHMDANNLPKVVTQQCGSRESNSRPSTCEWNAITIRLLSHPFVNIMYYYRNSGEQVTVRQNGFGGINNCRDSQTNRAYSVWFMLKKVLW